MRVIKPGDCGDDRVKALLTRHLEGMHATSPPGHVSALDWSGLQKPEISFYALWEGEDLLGFGALKEGDWWRDKDAWRARTAFIFLQQAARRCRPSIAIDHLS